MWQNKQPVEEEEESLMWSYVLDYVERFGRLTLEQEEIQEDSIDQYHYQYHCISN